MRTKQATQPYLGSSAMYTMKHPVYSVELLPCSERRLDAVPRMVRSVKLVCGGILTSPLPLAKTHGKKQLWLKPLNAPVRNWSLSFFCQRIFI